MYRIDWNATAQFYGVFREVAGTLYRKKPLTIRGVRTILNRENGRIHYGLVRIKNTKIEG